MRPLMEKLANWITCDLMGKTPRLKVESKRYLVEFHSPENAKAIREALTHPKHRKLALFMERGEWTKVCRMMREDHACEQLFSSLPGAVINAIFFLYRPPLDLILDYMISECNAPDLYLSAGLIHRYMDHRADKTDRVYAQHALLRQFRPDELVIFKPKLFHNPQTDVYYFALRISTSDPRMQYCFDVKDTYNVFLGYPCCTYSLLTEAGFKVSPLKYHKTADPKSALGHMEYPESNTLSQGMIKYCREHERNCASLLVLCRNTIRRHMTSLDLRYLQQLMLPVELEKFLTLENVDCPIFRKYTGKPFPKLDFQDFCMSPQEYINHHAFLI